MKLFMATTILTTLYLQLLMRCSADLGVVCDDFGHCKTIPETEPKQLPADSISVPYHSLVKEDDGACLKLVVPADVYTRDAELTPDNGKDFEIRVYASTNRAVKALGFLRSGCYFKSARDNKNGCKFTGLLGAETPADHLISIYDIGHPGVEYHACFAYPLIPVSQTKPLQFSLQYYVASKL